MTQSNKHKSQLSLFFFKCLFGKAINRCSIGTNAVSPPSSLQPVPLTVFRCIFASWWERCRTSSLVSPPLIFILREVILIVQRPGKVSGKPTFEPGLPTKLALSASLSHLPTCPPAGLCAGSSTSTRGFEAPESWVRADGEACCWVPAVRPGLVGSQVCRLP